MVSVRTTRSMFSDPTTTTPDLGPAADAFPGPAATSGLSGPLPVCGAAPGGGATATG